jgi:hypothetical protein
VFTLVSPFSGCSDLWASLLGGSELWVYGILASWVFGCPDSRVYCNPGSSDSSAHLDLWLSVWMFAAGRMVFSAAADATELLRRWKVAQQLALLAFSDVGERGIGSRGHALAVGPSHCDYSL